MVVFVLLMSFGCARQAPLPAGDALPPSDPAATETSAPMREPSADPHDDAALPTGVPELVGVIDAAFARATAAVDEGRLTDVHVAAWEIIRAAGQLEVYSSRLEDVDHAVFHDTMSELTAAAHGLDHAARDGDREAAAAAIDRIAALLSSYARWRP